MKAHRLLNHSTLGLRAIKKWQKEKKKRDRLHGSGIGVKGSGLLSRVRSINLGGRRLSLSTLYHLSPQPYTNAFPLNPVPLSLPTLYQRFPSQPYTSPFPLNALHVQRICTCRGCKRAMRRDLVPPKTARHVPLPVSSPRLLRTMQQKGLCLSTQKCRQLKKLAHCAENASTLALSLSRIHALFLVRALSLSLSLPETSWSGFQGLRVSVQGLRSRMKV